MEEVFSLLYETIENAYGFYTKGEHLCYEEDELRSLKKMLGKSKQAVRDFEEAREYVECAVYGETYYCFSDHIYDKEKESLYEMARNCHYAAFGVDGLKKLKGGRYMLYSVVPTFTATNGYYEVEVDLDKGWYLTLHSLMAKILIEVG